MERPTEERVASLEDTAKQAAEIAGVVDTMERADISGLTPWNVVKLMQFRDEVLAKIPPKPFFDHRVLTELMDSIDRVCRVSHEHNRRWIEKIKAREQKGQKNAGTGNSGRAGAEECAAEGGSSRSGPRSD